MATKRKKEEKEEQVEKLSTRSSKASLRDTRRIAARSRFYTVMLIGSLFYVIGLTTLVMLDVVFDVFDLPRIILLMFIIYIFFLAIFAVYLAFKLNPSRFARIVRGEITRPEVQRQVIRIVREEVVKDPELKNRLRLQDKQMKDLSLNIDDLTAKLRHSQVNMILVLGVFAGLIAFVISGVSATRAMTPAGIGLTLTGLAICLGFVVILLSILFGGKRLLWLRILLLLIIIAGGVFWMHTTLNHPSNYTAQVESSADTSSTQSSQ